MYIWPLLFLAVVAVSFAEASYVVDEGAGTVEVCVQLSLVVEPTEQEVLVNISAIDGFLTLGKTLAIILLLDFTTTEYT